MAGEAARSWPVPEDDSVFLDHIAHFVPDMEAASEAMRQLGFALTPYSLHMNTDDPSTPPRPGGTANRLAMLRHGYLEVLTATNDETTVARQLLDALRRYVGVHLIAFCCRDPEAQHRRLAAAGFPVQPIVDLRRETEDESGKPDTVRFTVIRPQPGAMREGRIQFLRHDRPDLMWQTRWLEHPNRAQALSDVVVCCEDVAEAANRFERYLDREARAISGGALLSLERGHLVLLAPDALRAALPGIAIPSLPWIAGYALETAEIGTTKAVLRANRLAPRETGPGVIWVAAPPALGGILVFTERNTPPPWRTS